MTPDYAIHLQECAGCGRVRWPHRPACQSCLEERFTLRPASGKGRVWTYTVLHRTTPALQDETPFAVAIVELDDKPGLCRVTGRVRGCRAEDVAIGMPVKLVPFCDAGGELQDIWFEPSATQT